MRTRNARSGFTLIEIMVVMMIIGLLMALVGPNLMGSARKAEKQAARIQLENLRAALRQRPFGVDRWDGPYLKKEVPKDPWDRPYLYRSPGDGGRPYDIVTLG